MPSTSAYLDMILIDPKLKEESGFSAVCRLALMKYENDPYFSGHRYKTRAYDIASNVMDVYFDKNPPITKRRIADRIGMKSLGRWSITAHESKNEYKEFQKKLKSDVDSWRERE